MATNFQLHHFPFTFATPEYSNNSFSSGEVEAVSEITIYWDGIRFRFQAVITCRCLQENFPWFILQIHKYICTHHCCVYNSVYPITSSNAYVHVHVCTLSCLLATALRSSLAAPRFKEARNAWFSLIFLNRCLSYSHRPASSSLSASTCWTKRYSTIRLTSIHMYTTPSSLQSHAGIYM